MTSTQQLSGRQNLLLAEKFIFYRQTLNICTKQHYQVVTKDQISTYLCKMLAVLKDFIFSNHGYLELLLLVNSF